MPLLIEAMVSATYGLSSSLSRSKNAWTLKTCQWSVPLIEKAEMSSLEQTFAADFKGSAVVPLEIVDFFNLFKHTGIC